MELWNIHTLLHSHPSLHSLSYNYAYLVLFQNNVCMLSQQEKINSGCLG
jgi:hypothetical protein